MIYFILNTEKNTVKIGYTNSDVKQRLSDLQTGSPEKLDVLATMEGGAKIESELHAKFQGARLSGEWFVYTKEIENFVLLNANTHLDPTFSNDQHRNIEHDKKNMAEYLMAVLPPMLSRQSISDLMPGVISPRYLANLDSQNKGPVRYKLGRKCFYKKEDFVMWFTKNMLPNFVKI